MKISLRNVAEFTQGVQISLEDQKKESKEGDMRFIRIVDFSKNNNEPHRYIKYENKYKKAIIKKDEIAMIRYGSQTVGQAIIGYEGIIANNLFKINILDEKLINKKYLYYYFISNKFTNYIKKTYTSSTMPAINFGSMYNVEINLPSLEKQTKIVDILSPIDEKIELNNKINKTLADVTQLLYKKWFIDFEFPNENEKIYKSNGGKMIYNEELDKEIPEGWEVKSLSDLFSFVKGKKPVNFTDVGDIYLTIDAINNGVPQFCNDLSCIDIKEKDIMMVMDGASSGKPLRGSNGKLGSTLSLLKTINSIDNEYLYQTIKFYEKDICEHTTGSAIPHTDKNYVYNIKVPYNTKIVSDFDKIVSSIYINVFLNLKQNKNLKNQKDLLLNKYFQ